MKTNSKVVSLDDYKKPKVNEKVLTLSDFVQETAYKLKDAVESQVDAEIAKLIFEYVCALYN